MLGPFTTLSRLTPTHQISLAVLSCAACASMSTTSTTTTNAWQRGPLWPHGMGPISSRLKWQCKYEGAPRLLQAIAMDGVMPFLNFFGATSKHGEPVRALLLTSLIAEAGILIANIDNIAPITSECVFLNYYFHSWLIASLSSNSFSVSVDFMPIFMLYLSAITCAIWRQCV